MTWSPEQRRAFHEGRTTLARSSVAIFIWALVTGIAMAKSSMTTSQALGMSLLVYAGSAQLVALPLIGAQFPIWTIWMTATIVNLRFVIFSAGILPHFKNSPLWLRSFLGYINGDLNYILFTKRYPEADESASDEALRLPFYLGLALTNWATWQTGSIIGILFASFIPTHWGLGFAGILALIAIVMPVIDHGSARIAALVAAGVAIVAVGLPYKLNVLLAVLSAIAVGMALDKRHAKQRMTEPTTTAQGPNHE